MCRCSSRRLPAQQTVPHILTPLLEHELHLVLAACWRACDVGSFPRKLYKPKRVHASAYRASRANLFLRVQVEVEEVREEHQQKLTTVLTAMHEALAESGNGALVPADGLGPLRTQKGAKRSGSSDSTDSPSPPAKRRNRGFLPAAFDELSSDSDDDDTGNDAQATATLVAAARGAEVAAEPDAGGQAAGAAAAADEEPVAAKEAAPQPQEASERAAARTLGSRAGNEQPAEPRDTARAVATATVGNNAGSEMTTAAGPDRQPSISGPRGSFVAGVRQASMALSATAPQAAGPSGAVAVTDAAGSVAVAGSAAGAQRDSSGAESNGLTAASAAEPVAEIDLAAVGSVEELEACGLDALKAALQKRGLKAGGTVKERASRLWLLKTMPLEQLDRKHFAKSK